MSEQQQQHQARYQVPSGPVQVEQKIKHSLFIAQIFPTPDQGAALACVESVRQAHARANHNCWAYIAGPPQTGPCGQSDDGEPRGCAGKPMLSTLQYAGLGEVCAVVTRYFGGVKLGTGGLVRAYTATVQLALEQMVLVEKVPMIRCSFTLGYQQLQDLERVLQQVDAQVLEKAFSEKVCLQAAVPLEKRSELAMLLAACPGRISWSEGDLPE